MTLHQLKAFAMVAELGSFTEAGVILDLRQPSVTALIQGLERDLDLKLFDRFGHKIRLSGAGEKLLPYAKNILAESDQIAEEVEDIKRLKKGKLSVGTSHTAGTSFMPIAVKMFKEKFPEIQFLLRIARSNILERDLIEGVIDVAILSRPPAACCDA